MDFTLKKYKKEIEESMARLKAASEFKEQDRVPIVIGLGNSFFCKEFNYNIRDYYQDLDTNILFRRVFMEVVGERKGL